MAFDNKSFRDADDAGTREIARNFAARKPEAIDDWFPRLGLHDPQQNGPGMWRATATWPGDRLLPKSEEEPDTWVTIFPTVPHYVTVDFAGDILCTGMEQQIWTPLDFVALAMGYQTPEGDWDHEKAWEFIAGEPEELERAEKPLDRADKLFELLTPMSQIEASLENRYLLKGWFDRGAASVIYGESNVGKTFFAVDICGHIAAGLDWHGHTVTPNDDCEAVIYVAAEGGHGIRNRFQAMKLQRPELDTPQLFLLPTALDFFGHADAAALIEMCRRHGITPRLIVLDTLARTMGAGDENATKDMGAYVANVDALRDVLSAHVMIIHHSGKDTTKGARGSVALRAAVDTEIELTRDWGVVTAAQRKQRDMPLGDAFAYTLEKVQLGHDEDGEAVTSAVIEPAEVRRDTSRITGAAGIALAALDTLLDREGEPMLGNLLPPDRPGIRITSWRAECDLRQLSEGNADAKRSAFNRAKSKLESAGVVGVQGEYAWRMTDD